MADMSKIMAALGGFGAGYQGRGAQYLQGIQNEKILDQEQQDKQMQLDEKRKAAMVQDAWTVNQLLDQGKAPIALKLLDNRIENIQKLKGDPSDTMAIKEALVSGDPARVAQAKQELQIFSEAGIAAGAWQPPQESLESKKFTFEQEKFKQEQELAKRAQDWKEKNPNAGVARSPTPASLQEIAYYNSLPEGPLKIAAGKKLGMVDDDTGTKLSDAAKDLLADRLLNGEKPKDVLGNIGRGAQGASDLRDVQNRFADKAASQGKDARKILQETQNVYADNRTFLELGAREGKIATRVQEANLFADIALKASKEVPRDSFVPWNKLSQYTGKQLSDPKLAALHAATQSLVNAYASAVGGGVMTEGNRLEANRMLYDAQGPEAYEAVVNQMLVETQAALDSPKMVRKHMHGDTGSHDKPKQNVKWDELP